MKLSTPHSSLIRFSSFVFITFISLTSHVYASPPGLSSTFPAQMLQLAEEAGTTVSSANTSIQQTIQTVSDTVGVPISNALVGVATKSISASITAWGKKGFNGSPLVIVNPQLYIKQKGIDQVTIDINLVPKGNLYSNSILKSLTQSNKNVSVATRLNTLSISNIPSIVQKDLCAPAKLLETAQNDTRNSDGSVNSAAAKARQIELSSSLCAGNPATDPALAKKLQSVADQQPSLGGWDRFLTTANDNEYTRTVIANNVVAQDKYEKIAAVQADFRKENVRSDTKCAQKDPTTGLCTKEQVITPSGIVQSSIGAAANSGLSRITSLTGLGGLTGLLTGFATDFLMKGLTNALTDSETTSNTARVTASITKPSGDLINQPDTKASLIAPILKQLDSSFDAFTSIESVDSSYLTDISAYESKLLRGQQCFRDLKRDYPGNSNVDQANAESFYSNRLSIASPIKASLQAELSKVTDGKRLITSTKATIETATSSETINAAFNAYSSESDKNNYPSAADAKKRELDHTNKMKDTEKDNETINNYQNSCSATRAQLESGSGSPFIDAGGP